MTPSTTELLWGERVRLRWLAFVLCCACGPGMGPATFSGPGAKLSVHTSLGLPSPATVGDPSQWLLVKPQFVVAYDTKHFGPKWVSWELSAQWLGTVDRTHVFRPDPDLPADQQARLADFLRTGLDRGHMCPSADRTDGDVDNQATFVLTNVVPQFHGANAGCWEGLETETRRLVNAGKRAFITAGPIVAANDQTIGGNVDVPQHTFKVVTVLDPMDTAVTSQARIIAAVMPNDAGCTQDWRTFRTTVRHVEELTGLDFMSDLPRDTQDALEVSVDTQ